MSTSKPADHLATRTIIGQGRKKAPPVLFTFNGNEYDLPGKASVGFIEAAADAAGRDLPQDQAGMLLLTAFIRTVVPKDLREDLRQNGDQDDLNDIFAAWNKAVGVGESSGSSD